MGTYVLLTQTYIHAGLAGLSRRRGKGEGGKEKETEELSIAELPAMALMLHPMNGREGFQPAAAAADAAEKGGPARGCAAVTIELNVTPRLERAMSP